MILTKDYKVVYNDNLEILICGKIEGETETIFPCAEFDSQNEMQIFISDNNLSVIENNISD